MSLKLPYFKLDVIDWLKSEKIEFMHNECVGAYITLLCEAWTRPYCSLPCDPLALMKLARWTGDPQAFNPVLACFTPLKNDPKRVINVKLRKVWDEAHAKVAALSEAGKKGAQIKQERREKKHTPKTNHTTPSTQFEQFWLAYPNKVGKKAALKAFEAAKDKPDINMLVGAVIRSAQSAQWTKENGKYIPHPSTWLNEGRWSDQPLSNGSNNLHCHKCNKDYPDLAAKKTHDFAYHPQFVG